MTVPSQRLTAVDIYRYLVWLEEAFAAGDEEIEKEIEIVVQGKLRLVRQRDFQLRRLELVLQHLNASHYQAAMDLVGELKRALIAEGVDWHAAIRRLHRVVHEWEQARPKFECGFDYGDGAVCRIAFRSAAAHATHREILHGVTETERKAA